MIVKSKIEGLNEWLFIEEIPDRFSPGSTTISEKKVTIERSPIRMTNHQLSCGGLFIMHSEMKFTESVRIFTGVEGETITSQFIFYYPVSNGKARFNGASRHNIRFVPSTSATYELKAGIDYSYFLMVLSKEYYYKLIDRHSSLHEDFVQEIEKGLLVSYATADMQVTPEMLRIIHEIRDIKKSGELRRLHTEAKVLELLIYQIEQLSSENVGESRLLRESDVEKLELARAILESRFVDPPNQRELAQEVMLNESKLRRGFKEYFATTIYDYITRLRMELAKKLLLNDGKTIYETSLLTGFKHQANFSIAFKKYFGISPSDVVGIG